MSVLTRIKNNQITDSTIFANTKIAPGSIVGSLFSSNITVTSDFLITGNFTVLGSSTVSTVASTNTFVNDPLIVLNNAFSGTNTYDLGLVFNRGSSTNQAFIWNESNSEFRLLATSETGSTYGNVNQTSFANIRLGNVAVQYDQSARNVTLSGDIAVNGGDLTTSASTFNLLNSTATTLNIGGAATTVNVGATSGVSIINSGNLYLPYTANIASTQSTVAVFNTDTTAINAFGAATTLTMGATSGTATVRNATLSLPNTSNIFVGQTTATIANTVVTSLGIGGATTLLNIGGAGGVVSALGNLVVTNSITATANLTVDTITANTKISIGSAVSNLGFHLRNNAAGDQAKFETTSNQNNLQVVSTSGTVALGTWNSSGKGYVGTPNADNFSLMSNNSEWVLLDINGNVGIANTSPRHTLSVTGNAYISGDLAVNGGDLTTSASTFNLLDSTATTVNAFGSATSVVTGATTGTYNIRNANLYLPNATTIYTGQTTLDIANVNVTTLGIGGAASVVNAGAQNSVFNHLGNVTIQSTAPTTSGSTGALVVNGGVAIAGDLRLAGNLYLANVIGTITNTITVQDPLLYLQSGNTYPYNYDIGFYSSYTGGPANVYAHTGLIKNDSDYQWYLIGNIAEPSAGAFSLTDAIYETLVLGNIVLKTPGGITTDQTTTNLVNTTATTVNLGGAATTLTMGATSGTATINNAVLSLPTASNIFVGQTTATIANTVVTSLGIGGATTVLNLGGSSGAVNALNNLNVGTDLTVTGDAAVNGGDLTTSAGTFNLVNANATTLNIGGAATSVVAGATTGTFNLRNANIYLPNATTIFTGQSTVDFANTATTTLNTAGSATAIAIGAATGTTTFRHDVNIATVSGTATTSYLTGALKVNGGIGVTGNIMIKSGQQFILGGDLAASTASGNILTPVNSQVQFYSNTNSNVRVVIQNINSGATATVGTAYVHETGTPGNGYFDVGIMSGSGANLGSLKSGDGFAYVQETSAGYGGNLHLGAGRNIRMFAGGDLWLDSQQVVEIFDGNLSFAVVSTTAATSASTGALTVTGGVGIRSNLWVANGAVINSSQSSENFTVRGKVTTSLIQTDSAYGAVIIGGSNASPQLGATLKVNSTDSLMLPVGSTAQRPSNSGNVDVKGMVRYNNTINTMEFYDGAIWQITGSVFTVISDRQFTGNSAYGNVDGVNTTFTLQGNATTASTLISINGIVQFPVLAYSVTDDILEFTEAPAVTDVIDARILTTTQTVSSIASGNGYNQFLADGNGSSIYTGTNATVERVKVDTVGNMNFLTGNKVTYDQTVVNVPSSGTPVLVDTWAVASYGTAKYIVQAKNGANKVESMEVLLAAEGSNAYMTTYAVVNSNGVMGTLSANVVSGNARLYYTSTSLSNSNVKVMTTLIV